MSETQMNSLLEELYQEYYKVVYDHCLHMLGYNERLNHLIDDCVQEAFVTYMLSEKKLRNHPNPVGWLCKTAWNRMRNAIRMTSKDNRIVEELINDVKVNSGYIEPAFDLWSNIEAPSSKLTKIDQSLTEIERKVFDSYFLDDLSLDETAAENHISMNSVRSALDRIRKRAKKK